MGVDKPPYTKGGTKMFDYSSILTNPTSGDAICGVDDEIYESYKDPTNLLKFERTDMVYVDAAFDKAKEYFESRGYEITSAQEVAKLRIKHGKDARSSRFGGRTKDGFLYVPQKGIFLVKNSIIMTRAEKATDCHRKKKEFYLTTKQLEKSLEGSTRVSENPIPTNRFGEDALTVHLFKETAQNYGELLKEEKINQLTLELKSTKEKPFMRQMWFGGSRHNFKIYDWALDYPGFGVYGKRKTL